MNGRPVPLGASRALIDVFYAARDGRRVARDFQAQFPAPQTVPAETLRAFALQTASANARLDEAIGRATDALVHEISASLAEVLAAPPPPPPPAPSHDPSVTR